MLKNEYVQTCTILVLMVAIVFGFWYGSQLVLNTEYPALAVASGSMCMIQHMNCDGLSHPFGHTLHVGDLIIIQGVAPEEINAAPYPEGDIIVFRNPRAGEGLIVHRAVRTDPVGEDGVIFFRTKGDGNTQEDSTPVRQDYVVGKVVLRVPWIGHIALLMRDSLGVFIILLLLAILVIVEFVIPAFSVKEPPIDKEDQLEEYDEMEGDQHLRLYKHF